MPFANEQELAIMLLRAIARPSSRIRQTAVFPNLVKLVAICLIGLAPQVGAQEIKPMLYVAFRPPDDLQLPMVKSATVEKLSGDPDEILDQASAVVVRANEMSDFQDGQIARLRSFVTRPGGPLVFAIRDAGALGFKLAPDFLETQLRVRLSTRVEPDEEEGEQAWKFVALGLYRRPGLPARPIDGVHLRSTAELQLKEILVQIYELVIDLRQRKARPVPAEWRPKSSVNSVLLCDGHGKFRQEVAPYILRNSPNPHDFWYVKIDNASIPEPGVSNSLNEVKCTLDSANKLIGHGPQGAVPKFSTATVTITSGPQVSWDWETGATNVDDLTNASLKEAAWEVSYDPSGTAGLQTFHWFPGAEAENPKGKSFSVTFQNKIGWLDGHGTLVDFRRTWRLTSAP